MDLFKYQFFKKVLASVISLAFLAQDNVSLYASLTPDLNKVEYSSLPIFIPKELGSVIDSYQAPRAKRAVILFQDIHAHEEAQKNTVELLEYLSRKYGVHLVNIEAASGHVPTEYFRSFPEKDVLREVSYYYMSLGQLTGAEVAAINGKEPLELYGIEDKDLYLKNYQIYQDTFALRKGMREHLSGLKNLLTQLQDYIYSGDARDFVRQMNLYAQHKIDLDAFLVILVRESEREGLNLEAYPALEGYVKLLDLKKKVDFKKLHNEMAKLLVAVNGKASQAQMDKFMEVTLAFRLNDISPTEFYETVKKFAELSVSIPLPRGEGLGEGETMSPPPNLPPQGGGIEEPNHFNPLSIYPNISTYMNYLESDRQINDIRLFKEIRSLGAKTLLAQCTSEEEKSLAFYSSYVDFLDRVADLSLEKSEYEEYVSKKNEQIPKLMKFMKDALDNAGIEIKSQALDYPLSDHLSQIEPYYAATLERDHEMSLHTLARLKKDDSQVSAVIAGGFHTPGLAEALKESGYSYVVVIPNMSDRSGDHYEEVMMGKRTPFEEWVKGNVAQEFKGQKSEVRSQKSEDNLMPVLMFMLSTYGVDQTPLAAMEIETFGGTLRNLYAQFKEEGGLDLEGFEIWMKEKFNPLSGGVAMDLPHFHMIRSGDKILCVVPVKGAEGRFWEVDPENFQMDRDQGRAQGIRGVSPINQKGPEVEAKESPAWLPVASVFGNPEDEIGLLNTQAQRAFEKGDFARASRVYLIAMFKSSDAEVLEAFKNRFLDSISRAEGQAYLLFDKGDRKGAEEIYEEVHDIWGRASLPVLKPFARASTFRVQGLIEWMKGMRALETNQHRAALQNFQVSLQWLVNLLTEEGRQGLNVQDLRDKDRSLIEEALIRVFNQGLRSIAEKAAYSSNALDLVLIQNLLDASLQKLQSDSDPSYTFRLKGIKDEIQKIIKRSIPKNDDSFSLILGCYKIVGTLASGGEGDVYEAEVVQPSDGSLPKGAPPLGTRVIVKLRRPLIGENVPLKEAAENEIRIQRKIGRAAPKIFWDGDYQPRTEVPHYAIVMEYGRGMTLKQWMGSFQERARAGTLTDEDIQRVRKCVQSLLRTLRMDIHEEEVIHLDIKPENILYDEEKGDLTFLDFGIARVVDAKTKTVTVKAKGTLPYMSPELADGLDPTEGSEVGFPSDYFSLGVVIFEMLFGENPFVNGSEIDSRTLLMNIVVRDWFGDHSKDERLKANYLPKDLVELVKGLLEKNSQKRFDAEKDFRMGDALSEMRAAGKEGQEVLGETSFTPLSLDHENALTRALEQAKAPSGEVSSDASLLLKSAVREEVRSLGLSSFTDLIFKLIVLAHQRNLLTKKMLLEKERIVQIFLGICGFYSDEELKGQFSSVDMELLDDVWSLLDGLSLGNSEMMRVLREEMNRRAEAKKITKGALLVTPSGERLEIQGVEDGLVILKLKHEDGSFSEKEMGLREVIDALQSSRVKIESPSLPLEKAVKPSEDGATFIRNEIENFSLGRKGAEALDLRHLEIALVERWEEGVGPLCFEMEDLARKTAALLNELYQNELDLTGFQGQMKYILISLDQALERQKGIQRAEQSGLISSSFQVASPDPSHEGKQTQDAAFLDRLPNGIQISLIADGVGGHAAGEVASHIARWAIHEYLYSTFLNLSPEELTESLIQNHIRIALLRAHDEIRDELGVHLEWNGMGTTALVIVQYRDSSGKPKVIFGNVGDSRGYLVSKGRWNQVTVDDSFLRSEATHWLEKGYLSRNPDPIAAYQTLCLGIDLEGIRKVFEDFDPSVFPEVVFEIVNATSPKKEYRDAVVPFLAQSFLRLPPDQIRDLVEDYLIAQQNQGGLKVQGVSLQECAQNWSQKSFGLEPQEVEDLFNAIPMICLARIAQHLMIESPLDYDAELLFLANSFFRLRNVIVSSLGSSRGLTLFADSISSAYELSEGDQVAMSTDGNGDNQTPSEMEARVAFSAIHPAQAVVRGARAKADLYSLLWNGGQLVPEAKNDDIRVLVLGNPPPPLLNKASGELPPGSVRRVTPDQLRDGRILALNILAPRLMPLNLSDRRAVLEEALKVKIHCDREGRFTLTDPKGKTYVLDPQEKFIGRQNQGADVEMAAGELTRVISGHHFSLKVDSNGDLIIQHIGNHVSSYEMGSPRSLDQTVVLRVTPPPSLTAPPSPEVPVPQGEVARVKNASEFSIPNFEHLDRNEDTVNGEGDAFWVCDGVSGGHGYSGGDLASLLASTLFGGMTRGMSDLEAEVQTSSDAQADLLLKNQGQKRIEEMFKLADAFVFKVGLVSWLFEPEVTEDAIQEILLNGYEEEVIESYRGKDEEYENLVSVLKASTPLLLDFQKRSPELFKRLVQEILPFVRDGRISLADKMSTTGAWTQIFETSSGGKKAVVAHAGDSRVYVISVRGEIRHVTKDHSPIREMLEMDQVSPEFISLILRHPQNVENILPSEFPDREDLIRSVKMFLNRRNLVYLSLGSGDLATQEEKIDFDVLNLEDGDVVLALSDGITDVLTEEEISQMVQKNWEEGQVAIVQELTLRAYSRSLTKLIASSHKPGGSSEPSEERIYNALVGKTGKALEEEVCSMAILSYSSFAATQSGENRAKWYGGWESGKNKKDVLKLLRLSDFDSVKNILNDSRYGDLRDISDYFKYVKEYHDQMKSKKSPWAKPDDCSGLARKVSVQKQAPTPLAPPTGESAPSGSGAPSPPAVFSFFFTGGVPAFLGGGRGYSRQMGLPEEGVEMNDLLSQFEFLISGSQAAQRLWEKWVRRDLIRTIVYKDLHEDLGQSNSKGILLHALLKDKPTLALLVFFHEATHKRSGKSEDDVEGELISMALETEFFASFSSDRREQILEEMDTFRSQLAQEPNKQKSFARYLNYFDRVNIDFNNGELMQRTDFVQKAIDYLKGHPSHGQNILDWENQSGNAQNLLHLLTRIEERGTTAMKPIGLREDTAVSFADEELQAFVNRYAPPGLSPGKYLRGRQSQRTLFEAARGITLTKKLLKKQTLYQYTLEDGMVARIIYASNAQMKRLAAHHFVLNDRLYIVINQDQPMDIQLEGLFHEGRERLWMTRGFTEVEAHCVASAEQVKMLRDCGVIVPGEITPYQKAQLYGMDPEELEALLKETENQRAEQHAALAKANDTGQTAIPVYILDYEQKFRLFALSVLGQKLPVGSDRDKKFLDFYFDLNGWGAPDSPLKDVFTPEVIEALIADPRMKPVFLLTLEEDLGEVAPLKIVKGEISKSLTDEELSQVLDNHTGIYIENLRIAEEFVKRTRQIGNRQFGVIVGGQASNAGQVGRLRVPQVMVGLQDRSRPDFRQCYFPFMDQNGVWDGSWLVLENSDDFDVEGGTLDTRLLGSRNMGRLPQGILDRLDTSTMKHFLVFKRFFSWQTLLELHEMTGVDPGLHKLCQDVSRAWGRSTDLTPSELLEIGMRELGKVEALRQNHGQYSVHGALKDFTFTGEDLTEEKLLSADAYRTCVLQGRGMAFQTSQIFSQFWRLGVDGIYLKVDALINLIDFSGHQKQMLFPSPEKTLKALWDGYFQTLDNQYLSFWAQDYSEGNLHPVVSVSPLKLEVFGSTSFYTRLLSRILGWAELNERRPLARRVSQWLTPFLRQQVMKMIVGWAQDEVKRREEGGGVTPPSGERGRTFASIASGLISDVCGLFFHARTTNEAQPSAKALYVFDLANILDASGQIREGASSYVAMLAQVAQDIQNQKGMKIVLMNHDRLSNAEGLCQGIPGFEAVKKFTDAKVIFFATPAPQDDENILNFIFTQGRSKGLEGLTQNDLQLMIHRSHEGIYAALMQLNLMLLGNEAITIHFTEAMIQAIEGQNPDLARRIRTSHNTLEIESKSADQEETRQWLQGIHRLAESRA
ncbi:MAG: protein phosphatase 2C domain-containing protein [Chlamydiae bacterium]|nr:protein phosphatase 2C domain-containing protein [Chlamydiota bacterium]